MKLTTSTLSVISLALNASALVIHEARDLSGNFELEKRNAYQVGVNILDQLNCAGRVLGVRSHDEHSCNAATVGTTNWQSAYVKDDGTAHGYGCMSIFTDTKCGAPGSQAAVYRLDGNTCINFPWKPQCVVVASRNKDGDCNIRGPDC